MMRLKYCPDLIKDVDAHRAIALSARFRRQRRCVNVLFLAAAVTMLFAPLLLNTDVDNVSFIGLSDQKVEHLIADDSVSDIKRKTMVPVLAGYIGKTNSVMSSALTPSDVSYTGSWAWVDDGNGNYRIRFLTSGTLTLAKGISVDVWMCGGGAGGGSTGNGTVAAGAGGGRTGQWNSVELVSGVAYSIVVGAGGSPSADGGATGLARGALNIYVSGGSTPNPRYYGGHGGSGGGGGCANGGANGGNGAAGAEGPGGNGQGFSTYEFMNASLTLYAGGGGGGAGGNNWDPNFGWGGAGGGARGGDHNGGTGWSAAANTGGGGGGGGGKADGGATGGTGGWGGSGILVIRNHR